MGANLLFFLALILAIPAAMFARKVSTSGWLYKPCMVLALLFGGIGTVSALFSSDYSDIGRNVTLGITMTIYFFGLNLLARPRNQPKA